MRWLFYAVVCLVAGLLLFVVDPGDLHSRSARSAWELGHLLLFALLARLLIRERRIAVLRPPTRWLVVIGSAVLLGSLIELLQLGTARTPDMQDVYRGVLGALLVLVFSARPGGTAGWRLLQAACIVLLLHQLWPLTRSLLDEAVARQQFPLLADFDTPFEAGRWSGSAGRSVVRGPDAEHGRVMQLQLGTTQYSGAALGYFNPDWSGYRALRVAVYNTGSSGLRLTCRIHDALHEDGRQTYRDRYNRSQLLAPGWNTFEFDLQEVAASPAGRRMDMRAIREFGCFSTALPAPAVIYLDRVELLP